MAASKVVRVVLDENTGTVFGTFSYLKGHQDAQKCKLEQEENFPNADVKIVTQLV